ncbi:regulator protein of stationary/sporulation gene expression [Aureimonas ureilytica]|uniref:Regulator protein of stationary/sporulation gene expression n=1 Tax=Aureimonas ureilytica TaxID=401562 RepID=A0A175RQB5_9HYPH|nr:MULTISPECIES: AbrB/MazE/SpoVT family DNA-binding domain-containing protein [Aureimonas]KTR05052.1 regulator protein of stationary/sporulation gene expression [Aureimonas ureilytica]
MRVTEKGQVTIPKPIRDKLSIGPGSEVAFVDRGDFVELVRGEAVHDSQGRREEISKAIAAMRGSRDFDGLTTDEYMDTIRGPRDDLDPR